MKCTSDLDNTEGAWRRAHNYQTLAIRSDQEDGKLFGHKRTEQSTQIKPSKY